MLNHHAQTIRAFSQRFPSRGGLGILGLHIPCVGKLYEYGILVSHCFCLPRSRYQGLGSLGDILVKNQRAQDFRLPRLCA